LIELSALQIIEVQVNGIEHSIDLISNQFSVNHGSPVSYLLCRSARADSFITSTIIGSCPVLLIRKKYIRVISFLTDSSWSSVIGLGLICLVFMILLLVVFRGYIIIPVCQIRTQNPYLNIMTLLKFDLIQRDGLLDREVLNM
jgi:hypothetical protein